MELVRGKQPTQSQIQVTEPTSVGLDVFIRIGDPTLRLVQLSDLLPKLSTEIDDLDRVTCDA